MKGLSFVARLCKLLGTHIRLILSCVLIVFLIVDRLNPSMDFINNDTTKIFIAILALFTLPATIAEIVRRPKNH